MDLTTLKNNINVKIRQKTLPQSITRENLSDCLDDVLTAIEENYNAVYGNFKSIATTSTVPGVPDSNVWYFAEGAGTYTAFLSAAAAPINVSEADGVVILAFDKVGGYWKKTSVPIQFTDGIITDKINSKFIQVIGQDTVNSLVYEPFSLTSGMYNHTASTFSGWGSAIGSPKNFNQITFKIQARQNITLVKTVIKTSDKDGTIIAAKDVAVNMTNGDTQLVTVLFDSVITNDAGNKLYFMFAANGYVSEWGRDQGSTSPLPYPAFASSSYITNGQSDFSGFALTDSPQVSSTILYIKAELQTQLITPSVDFSKKVAIASAWTEVVLPSRIYAIEGKETNIYFADVVFSNLKLNQLDFDITCTKGAQFEKFFRIAPLASDAGIYPLTIDVYFSGNKIATASTTIYISTANAASGITRNIIGIGDSTLASGQPLSTLINENAGGVMTLNFKGTQGSGLNKHEGRSGWAIAHFATAGTTYYKYFVSGVITTPNIGAIYTDGANQWSAIEINLTSGSGYINFFKVSGPGTSPTSGTLTKVSSNGDTTLTYTSWTSDSGNPFWNATTSKLDFSGYLTRNSITIASNDWIFIHLGINDVFGQTDDTLETQINTMVSNIRLLMGNIRSAAAVRIAICVTIMPSISQDAMGANYGNGQTLVRYIQNIKTWQKRIISEFDNTTERSEGIYLIPFNAVVDRENNFPMGTMKANARNTALITTFTNAVHPAQSGYDQMGDQLFAFLKYMA